MFESNLLKEVLKTFVFFSKVAFCCLLLQLLFEKYCDFNKFPTYSYGFLHWIANLILYYPISYFLVFLKNSNYLESYKKKHKLIKKTWPQFTFKDIVFGELVFLALCMIYNQLFKQKISEGGFLSKLLWFYLCIFSADLTFFLSHLLLHKKFYWIHKKHHEEVNTNAFSAGIKSLIESIFITLTDILPFFVFGRDINQFIAWILVGVLYNLEGHSTIKLFFIPSFFHVDHHLYIECNYGIGTYLDELFGTVYRENRVKE